MKAYSKGRFFEGAKRSEYPQVAIRGFTVSIL